jgi:hypothetical protein
MDNFLKKLCDRVPPRSLDVLRDYCRVWWLNPRMMQLNWEPIEDGSIERVEPACVTLGHELYVFAGYQNLDRVVMAVDILDLRTAKWVDHFDLPAHIAQTHQGLICEDERYIYQVAGQVGIQCSPCTADCFSFDAKTRVWKTLPPLPRPRYAPVTRLWNGRLHVLAGSREDRISPAREHWSLAVRHGDALEDRWRSETPIPRGGPHRSSAMIGDQLFVLGGQIGDRPPIPSDPKFTCDWDTPDEIFYAESYALGKGANRWRRVADMPVAVTHAEYSTLGLGQFVVILGGLMSAKMLANIIQVYDTQKDRWRIVGRMPWRNKGLVAAHHEGWLYAFGGQKHISPLDPGFGEVLKGGFRARFALA